MNKLIKTEIAIGFIVGIALIFGVGLWLGSRDRNIDSTSSKLPAEKAVDDTVSQKQDWSMAPKLLVLNAPGREIFSVDTQNLSKKSFYKIPTSNNINDALYSAVLGKLAYIESDGKTDKLQLVDLKNGKIKNLAEAYYGYRGDSQEVMKNKTISGLAAFSPKGYYLTYTTGGYEWCNDEILNVETKQSLLSKSEWCNSTRWSPSGKRMIVFNQSGMATSARLAISEKNNIQKIVDVNFKILKGDFDKIAYSEDRLYLAESILGADFIDEDQVVFVSSPEGNEAGRIFVYNDSNKSLRFVANIVDAEGFYPTELRVVRGADKVIVVLDGQAVDQEAKEFKTGKIISIDLATGQQQTIYQGANKLTNSSEDIYIKDIFGQEKYAAVEIASNDDEGSVKDRKLILIRLRDGIQKIISENINDSYAGFEGEN